MAATWDSLASSLEDVYVASVDCTKDEAKDTCQRVEIEGYPTLKLIENNVMYTYSGGRDLDSLKEFATEGYKTAKGKRLPKPGSAGVDETDVVIATDENIAELETGDKTVMLEFYAPWCGHCKNLVPAYSQLATTLAEDHPGIVAAKLDATVASETAKRYKIRGFPTLKVIKDKQVYDYQGERTAEAMLDFLKNPTGNSSDIPPPWSVYSEVEDTVLMAWEDIKIIFDRKRGAAILTYLAGVWTGCLIVSLLSFLLPKPKPRKAPTAPAAAAPVAASKKDK